ncbi:MAG: SDR family oxidoreductase [Spirochaetales bacterium]|nr:SDR family oxidoreductase [Spirochaetales bacterium]
MNLGLENKTVVITGASGGIGGAIAQGFYDEGANLFLTDMSEKVNEVAQVYGDKAQSLVADITNEEDRKKLLSATLEAFGTVDVLINCAGVSRGGHYDKVSEEDWSFVMGVNQDAVFHLSRIFLPEIEKTKGAVVNLASFASKRPTLFGDNATYTTSKHAVAGITKALAFEVAPIGVNVNAVAPGPVATEMIKQHSEEARKRITDMVPANRMADPTEIADLVVFLSSDRASYINGEIVNINGGLYMD